MNSKDIIKALKDCKDEGVIIPQKIFDEMKNFINENKPELEDALIPFPLELVNIAMIRVPCTYFFALGYMVAHQGEPPEITEEDILIKTPLGNPAEEVNRLLADMKETIESKKEWDANE